MVKIGLVFDGSNVWLMDALGLPSLSQ